ncbi:hypothetical protein FYJ34_11925 [Clostridiaceae bacterium 68-1-5]|uniref:Uncharacterized protein n=1 Tax=Suipraeoptans intestinalis TaxID=2606628 RepID=A0A6N7V2U9_9FIRM|nr:hypothetical protein [Suipraeoptans intestinalis]MSR94885.1 hypothetical protein [Suipraeoptans intestinalis]
MAEYTQIESEKEFEAAKKKIKEGEIDLIVRFSDGFEEQTKAYKEGSLFPGSIPTKIRQKNIRPRRPL